MMSECTRVLIIDDDPGDREVFKQYLRLAPGGCYEFAEGASGREGVERCAGFDPHCILLDYRLPDLNGLEILKSLAGPDGCPRYAIVMLTGMGDEHLAVAAMKAGVMDYVSKGSATAETLHHTISNAVERFRMQRQLAQQQQRYRTLLEAIPLMVWSTSQDGEIRFANARWHMYTGSNAPDWTAPIHPEDRAAVMERWAGALESGNVFETEARLKRHDGQYRWHLLRAVPLAGEAGNRTWLSTATDIADQKGGQQALLHQQKQESIGLLAGGIAHDFNNLLVGIMGGTSFALEAMPRAHPAHSMLQTVLDASERAAHLTRQMLAYAGKGQFVIQRIDLSSLVACTSELAQALIPDSVKLELHTAVDLPPIESDAGQVQQVVMNLVANAAEAIPEGAPGKVAVRTSRWEVSAERPAVDVWEMEIGPGTYVVLEVEDTGLGMDEETRTKMFDPFFSTKFTGRGLGLSAVHGIVRSNGGAIQVRSAPDEGTTFRVFFPAKEVPARRVTGSEAGRTAPPNGTLLVIDDEAVVRNVVQLALRRAGYEVVCAESGPQGLKAIETRPEISSVLLDMSMPEMSGQEVLVELQELRPDLPVIVCSGCSEDEVRRQFDGLDLAGVIQKPFTAEQLLSRVNAILAAQREAAGATP